MAIQRGRKWIQEVLKESKSEELGTSLAVDNEEDGGIRDSLAFELRRLVDSRATHQPMKRVHLVFLMSHSLDSPFNIQIHHFS